MWLEKFKEGAVLRQKYSLIATDREKRFFSYKPKEFVQRNLSELQQVQANYPFRLNAFVFDIDNPEEFEALDKLPTFQTFNRHNHKSHLVYMLDKPFEVRNHLLKLDIAKLFTQAKIYTHSDIEYRNICTKNPFNSEYEVRVIGGSIQNLFKNFQQVLEIEIPEKTPNLFNFNYYSQAANMVTFREVLRQWSKANARLYFTDRAEYERLLYEELERVNAIVYEEYNLTPLSDIAIEDNARNLIEWLDSAAPVMRERFIRRQKYKASLAAMSTNQKQRSLREAQIEEAYAELLEEGHKKITMALIARRVGLSRQNISQHYKPLILELGQHLKQNKKIITKQKIIT